MRIVLPGFVAVAVVAGCGGSKGGAPASPPPRAEICDDARWCWVDPVVPAIQTFWIASPTSLWAKSAAGTLQGDGRVWQRPTLPLMQDENIDPGPIWATRADDVWIASDVGVLRRHR